MTMPELSLSEFFVYSTCLGVILIALIFYTFGILGALRRSRRRKVNLTCRLCGYRFISRETPAYCPHCKTRNR